MYEIKSINKPEEITIKIIATSDVHGMIIPYDIVEDIPTTGSLAQVYSYVKEQRENKNQEVILLDNGDVLQGQPTVYYSNFIRKDKNIIADIMNFMQYDAATIGNHDIETGHEIYDRVREEFNFPWLAANIIDTKTGKPYFAPYTIIERKGIKTAILGLITPSIPHWVPQSFWEGLDFIDMLEAAKYWVDYIKTHEKPDILVGLFHSGVDFTYNNQNAETEKNENASLLVAKNVPGFDAIIAGHDHQYHNILVENTAGEDVILLDPRFNAKYVAVVNIYLVYDFEANKYRKEKIGINLDMEHCEPDNEIVKKYSWFYDEVRKYANTPICTFTKSVSSRESLFGDSAFTDLIHEIQLELTGADVSFAAPLSFDSRISKGTVYIKDMFKLYKFENLLYTIKMTGKEIKDYLEYSFSMWFNKMRDAKDHLLCFETDEEGNERLIGKFYNFSSAGGIIYTLDLTKPVGNRVDIKATADGTPFNYDKFYLVAINSYRANGGGRHLTDGAGIPFAELKKRIVKSSKKDLRQLVTDKLKEKKVITPKANGNWTIIPETYRLNGRKLDYSLLFENSANL